MAELASAFVDWLLRKVKMPFQVDVALITEVELQNFGSEDVDCLLEHRSFNGALLDFSVIHDVTFDQVSH